MSAPPLAPELWNCGAVVVIVGMCGWAVRLMRLGLKVVEMRYAVRQEATVHLRDLGPSLSVLHYASMWHLQQLLRTKKEATAADMPRVHVPFDVPSSSLRLVRSINEHNRAKMTFTIDVKSAGACAVQVLWNVRVDAFEHSHRHQHAYAAEGAGSHKTRVPQLPRSVFRRLGMGDSIRANRALPWVLSPVRRQARRHRLDDDKDCESPKDADSATLGQLLVSSNAFSSQSPMEMFEERGGSHEFTIEVPVETLFAPHEAEEASLAEETERDDAKDALASQSKTSYRALPDTEPRYGAVIIVGAPSLVSEGASSPKALFPWRTHSSRRKRSAEAEGEAATEEAVCECIAVDFLPTPAKAEKFAPSVVKRLVFTPSNVYSVQDIFGRDASSGGECVICLEGALSVVLLPCRHLCVCRVCLDEIDRCPICRSKFSTYACYAEKPGAADSQQLQVKVVDPV